VLPSALHQATEEIYLVRITEFWSPKANKCPFGCTPELAAGELELAGERLVPIIFIYILRKREVRFDFFLESGIPLKLIDGIMGNYRKSLEILMFCPPPGQS